MGLIGTEKAIRCQQCGSIEFEEKTIIKFNEALTIEKLRDNFRLNARAPLRAIRYEYHCKSCGKKME